jgi:uncharacterized membrane protein
MSIGPVQLLIVLALQHSDFHDDLIAELERMNDADVLRVIDALALRKDADGETRVRQLIDPGVDEAIEVACMTDVLEEIPNESEAALILIEHHWALPLRDVIASLRGFRISDGFIISPLDVAAMGLAAAERSDAVRAPDPERAVIP